MSMTTFNNSILLGSMRWGGEVRDAMLLEIGGKFDEFTAIVSEKRDEGTVIVFFD